MADPERLDERSEDHVLAERREKLERLRAAGIEPFPAEFDGRVEIAAVHAAHDELEAGEETEATYRVAGRIAARRGHGKAAFIDLVDGSGRIQLHSRADVVGDDAHELLTGLDLGDIVGVDGAAFKTRRGELSRARPDRQPGDPRPVSKAGSDDRGRARVA
jgi:lysyl-tRNA synthetase, class II